MSAAGRHLALLTPETLELDLSDPEQRRFGDYELLELVGEGGMGVVYRAHQSSLDRDVAVKLLAAGPWASTEFIERFRREAQNAARMQHPNIVAIYEVGSAEEMHFFSMRLVHGGSVAERIKRDGPLAPLHAAKLLRTVAEAVDYAHRLGVLHLDLKPANVLLDENGAPHVADFGLARRLDSALATSGDEISGTPSYMAPEQATPRTARITPATDIWGLGAILFELVTGQPPFLGESPQATLKLVVGAALRNPRELTPTLPRDLEAIILKCMEREASARYPSARALADDLGRFVEGRAVKARPLSAAQRSLRWAKREPRLALTAAFGVLALIIGLITTTNQWRRAEGNAQLAAVKTDLANERLWQARLDQAETAVRDGRHYDALPALAANIAEREALGLSAREDRIRIAAVERSAPRLIDVIAMQSDILGVALSPDGKSLAVATADENLHLLDAASGESRWTTNFHGITHSMPAEGTIALVRLHFSVDGRYLIGGAYIGAQMLPTPMGNDEVLFDVANGKPLMPPPGHFADFRDATFSADGAYALARSHSQHAVVMRTADWQPLGKPQPFDKTNPAWLLAAGGSGVASLIENFQTLLLQDPHSLAVRHRYTWPPTQRVTAWAASPDGATLVTGHLGGQIERIDFSSGKREIVVPSPIGRVGWISFSTDGRWFGAITDGGEVLVWDSASARLVAPPMRLNVAPKYHRSHLALDPATRTVLASCDLEMALWHLPDSGTAAQRLSGQFPHNSAWWLRAFAYAPGQGLIASDGGQGELRLWRVQSEARTGLRGAPLVSPDARADAVRIVAVEGNAVRVANAIDGAAIGPSITLPQAPTFASLTPDAMSLVAIAGPALFVFDAGTAAQRRPAAALPNDPVRVALNPDSHHVLLMFAEYRDGKNEELAQIWNLDSGAPSSAPVAFEFESEPHFSADGHTLLAWHGDRLELRDAQSLALLWPAISLGVPKNPINITEAKFSADGSGIDVLALTAQDEYSASRLWQFDARSGAELKQTPLSETGGGESFVFMPDRHALVVQRPDEGPLWWSDTQGAKELPGFGRLEGRALALAPDAGTFARATIGEIALTSTRSLQWLTPPLPSGLAEDDHLAQLVFSRDGNAVVGRSYRNEWLYWNVAPDERVAAQLQHEVALLHPDATKAKGGETRPLTATERATLRHEDPGMPRRGGVHPIGIPARGVGLQPALLDLSASYNVPIDVPGDTSQYKLNVPDFMPGLHRFLGVDYDARGAIQLSMKGFNSDPTVSGKSLPSRIEGIVAAMPSFAALDLLVAATTILNRGPLAYAVVELNYRDGSRERLPILYQRDVYAYWKEPAQVTARIAWRDIDAGSPSNMHRPFRLYNVHLANPHPERAVASIALEATDEAWSAPAFLAITAEPIGSPTAK